VTQAFALLLVLTTAISVGAVAEDHAAAARLSSSDRTCDPTPVRGFRTCANRAVSVRSSIERWAELVAGTCRAWARLDARGGQARVRIYSSWRSHRITPMHPRTFLIDPTQLVADAHPAPLRGC